MSVVQTYVVQFEKLCQSRTRVLVLVMILTAVAVVGFQNSTLNPGNGSLLLFPLLGIRTLPTHSSSDLANSAIPSPKVENREVPLSGERVKHHHEMNEIDEESDGFDIDGDGEQNDELSIDLGNGMALKKVRDPYGYYITIQKSSKEEKDSLVGVDGEAGRGFVSTPSKDGKTNPRLESHEVKHLDNNSPAPSPLPYPASSYVEKNMHVKQYGNSSDFVVNVMLNNPSSEGKKVETTGRNEETMSLENDRMMTNCKVARNRGREKKMKQDAMTISDMNILLSKSRASSCSMIPQWSSENDIQILDAKMQIMNAPTVKSDLELYPPLFRNISMFKRSYDLMENMLKVYVYKEGEKPIFHQPELTGIYSSEGWFMKHMEGSRHFVVEDPSQAHLFYIPFSSHLLQFRLYVPGSHSHANLIAHLEKYVDAIAAKYPFWNRTCGADHFVVACHDWATHETGRAMGTSIRALCNADVTEDFELGKDVSLPETYVRNRENPLRDLGGRPAKKRPILAFFAGQMHGYLRPILLQHWENNKDPDMKIFGPLPRGRKKKAAYIEYMKSSRYCICPRGYEVNSPRVVEAIFYECVPVIISDNFVPPFFEVLNWEAFSVLVPEKDVPRLKDILVSIPKKKYLRLLMGVRKVQQHFLWHRQPVKYDLFHMILHSIWFNRVFQLRVS